MSKFNQNISHHGNLLLMLLVPHLLWVSALPVIFFGFADIGAPVILVFGVIPVFDYVFSRSRSTPRDAQIGRIMTSALKMSPLLYVLIFSVLLTIQIKSAADLDWMTFILSTVSFATMGTIFIGAGHELIHKRPAVSRILGEFVFVIFGYWHFTLAHIHNHHALVATEEDNHAPKKGETFWRYMWVAYPKALSFTYTLLQQRRSKGQITTARYYGLLVVYLLTPLLTATAALYVAGPLGLIFYLLVALLSLLFAEAVFYVQHYDVTRQKGERIAAHHSWDSDHRFSSYLGFMVQRHGDHHLKWGRQYYLLYAHANSLYLPLGYPLMLLLALIPPVFFKIMHQTATSPRNAEKQLPQT